MIRGKSSQNRQSVYERWRSDGSGRSIARRSSEHGVHRHWPGGVGGMRARLSHWCSSGAATAARRAPPTAKGGPEHARVRERIHVDVFAHVLQWRTAGPPQRRLVLLLLAPRRAQRVRVQLLGLEGTASDARQHTRVSRRDADCSAQAARRSCAAAR